MIYRKTSLINPTTTMITAGRTFPMAFAVTALLLSLLLRSGGVSALNLAPFFTDDMNQHTLKENTPVGTVVYQLKGEDPEGSPVAFGIEGTRKLRVDPRSGQVTVAEEIDRESPVGELGLSNDNEIRLTVIIQGWIYQSSSQCSGQISNLPNLQLNSEHNFESLIQNHIQIRQT